MFNDNKRIKELEILSDNKVKIVIENGDKIVLDSEDTQYVAHMVKGLQECKAPPEAIAECVFDFIKQLIFVDKLTEEERELYFDHMKEEHELHGGLTLNDIIEMTPEQREAQAKMYEKEHNKKLN